MTRDPAAQARQSVALIAAAGAGFDVLGAEVIRTILLGAGLPETLIDATASPSAEVGLTAVQEAAVLARLDPDEFAVRFIDVVRGAALALAVTAMLGAELAGEDRPSLADLGARYAEPSGGAG